MDNKLRFNELPDDVKRSFVAKIVFFSIAIVFFIVGGIITGHVFELLLISIFFTALVLVQIYTIRHFMNGKYRRFNGICIVVKKPEYNIGTNVLKIAHIYGYSRAIVQIEDIQIQIPIANALDINEGDEVMFYAEKNDFQQISDDLFILDNPKCVKTVKVKAA